MKKFLFLAVTAVCMVSCFGDSYYESTSSPVDTFEFMKLEEGDTDGDSLFFGPSFYSSFFVFQNAAKDIEPGKEADKLVGGFGMSARQVRWPLDGKEVFPGKEKPNDNLFMTLFNELKKSKPEEKPGKLVENGFAVYYAPPTSVEMPEHDIEFTMKDVGTWTPKSVLIANTAFTVARAKGVDIKKFPGTYPEYEFKKFDAAAGEEGDYITVIVKGYAEGKDEPTEKVEISLVDFRENPKVKGTALDSVMTEWRSIDLSKLGDVDYIDFEIERSMSESEFPVYFCLDNLYSGVHVKY